MYYVQLGSIRFGASPIQSTNYPLAGDHEMVGGKNIKQPQAKGKYCYNITVSLVQIIMV